MPDPVSFFNPYDMCRMHGAGWWYVQVREGDAGRQFFTEDYDVEITFRPKDPPTTDTPKGWKLALQLVPVY